MLSASLNKTFPSKMNSVCVCACVRVCMHACMDTWMHGCMHKKNHITVSDKI